MGQTIKDLLIKFSQRQWSRHDRIVPRHGDCVIHDLSVWCTPWRGDGLVTMWRMAKAWIEILFVIHDVAIGWPRHGVNLMMDLTADLEG